MSKLLRFREFYPQRIGFALREAIAGLRTPPESETMAESIGVVVPNRVGNTLETEASEMRAPRPQQASSGSPGAIVVHVLKCADFEGNKHLVAMFIRFVATCFIVTIQNERAPANS